MANKLGTLLKKRNELIVLINNENDILLKLNYIERRLCIEREILGNYNLKFERV